MTPAQFKAIRHAAGMTQRQLAETLRISDGRTVRRWEGGEREISGPVTILMEMLHSGEWTTWRPQPCYSTQQP